MPNIFAYLDYREYLKTVYEERKASNPSFSYQVFADKAGFKSKSFLKLVIDGRKNLTEQSLAKLNSVLKLPPKAFSYFEDLVAFNQAKSLKHKNLFFEKVSAYTKRNSAKLILRNQYDFYSKWYHNTLRELVVMVDFQEDYERLGKMVKPALSARVSRQSVELLLKLGLIQKTTQGRYVQSDAVVSTGDEVQSLAVQNFHIQNLLLAGESIDTTPAHQRDISCLVAGLSEKGFAAFKSEIQALRKRLLKIANEDKDPKRVYHASFQFFPTSQVQE